MAIVYIGIGSNLGKKEENCLKAIKLLSGMGIVIREKSSIYETEPWGAKDQPMFINVAVEAETEKEPLELLETLKHIESDMGRQDSYRWGPRIIDLDILLYNDIVMNAPNLRIPHPLMHQREFILMPLSEIAPDKVHPVLKKTIRELLSGLK